MSIIDWRGFAVEIMEAWPEGGVDALDLEMLALKHGLLREVPGGFDPEKHKDLWGCAEKGDEWLERTYSTPTAECPARNG